MSEKDIKILKKAESGIDRLKYIVLAASALVLLLIVGLYMTIKGNSTDISFYKQLAEVTQTYAAACDERDEVADCDVRNIEADYDARNKTETSDTSSKAEVEVGIPSARVLDANETKLKDMLANYHEEEEQIRILSLLAYQQELKGDSEGAATYYEQIIRDFPDDLNAFSEYGLFLIRTGQRDAAEQLWGRYQEKIARVGQDGEYVRMGNMKAWEEAWAKL